MKNMEPEAKGSGNWRRERKEEVQGQKKSAAGTIFLIGTRSGMVVA